MSRAPASDAERRTAAVIAIAHALIEVATDFGDGNLIAGDVWQFADAAAKAVRQLAIGEAAKYRLGPIAPDALKRFADLFSPDVKKVDGDVPRKGSPGVAQ